MSTTNASTPAAPAALFKPFEWVGKRDQDNNGRYYMLSNIRDLASGVSVTLEMVERSQLDYERGDAPIIDSAVALRLTRMSIAAMNVIEELVDGHFDEMQNNAAAQRQIAKDNAK